MTKPPPVAKTLDEANQYGRAEAKATGGLEWAQDGRSAPPRGACVWAGAPDQVDATWDENPASSCLRRHRAAS